MGRWRDGVMANRGSGGGVEEGERFAGERGGIGIERGLRQDKGYGENVQLDNLVSAKTLSRRIYVYASIQSSTMQYQGASTNVLPSIVTYKSKLL